MDKNFIFREMNIDGCGGFADVAVRFNKGLDPVEIERLEELLERHKKMATNLNLDYGTDDIVAEALKQFEIETGKTAESLSTVTIEF